ncbi:putative toxin-antitoxin system toxin component [Candidatus Gastranaerophilus sp. (ex Termes propinquus)]|nr:putative toxin-antitoxin system toxin component [Candidatus Gastranaerophilus sp. (ex Termes propinquus)]
MKKFKSHPDKTEFDSVVRSLPREVLVDIYNENPKIVNFDKSLEATLFYSWAGGIYNNANDKIYLRGDENFNAMIFAHELGHAIANTKTGPDGAATWGVVDEKFTETYEKELQAFYEAGLTQEDCYGASSPQEAFAEAYALLTVPSQTKELDYKYLETYFPETILQAQRVLEETRELGQEERGRKVKS